MHVGPRNLLLAAAIVLGGRLPAAAQQAAADDIPFEVYRLGNGLRVILAPDRTTPVVAVNVWYDVGSRNERRGRTGFAHLFEHMMFQGSANVAKGDHMNLIERAGGAMNGTTSEDRTNYFQTVPANRINLALWLEADRMRALDVTAENLANQREVVKEERRMRVDNQPYSSSVYAALYTLPYSEQTCFAYGHEVIGSMDDLDAATLEDVKAFHATYYRPNNATLTVVGDFAPADVKRLIQEYFGDIPAGTTSPVVECRDAFTHLPARRVLPDPNANLPAVFLSYGIPQASHADTYALELLSGVLFGGESSRMHQRLVRGEKAALAVQPLFSNRRGPGLFAALAVANQGIAPDRLESLMEEEIQRVVREGVTAAELERAKNQLRSRTIRSRQTMMGKAEALQYFTHFHGDPAAVREDLARYQAVTLADVSRAAAEYLTPANRAVVVTQPGTQQPGNQE